MLGVGLCDGVTNGWGPVQGVWGVRGGGWGWGWNGGGGVLSSGENSENSISCQSVHVCLSEVKSLVVKTNCKFRKNSESDLNTFVGLEN